MHTKGARWGKEEHVIVLGLHEGVDSQETIASGTVLHHDRVPPLYLEAFA
jgi:hypothetical protein